MDRDLKEKKEKLVIKVPKVKLETKENQVKRE